MYASYHTVPGGRGEKAWLFEVIFEVHNHPPMLNLFAHAKTAPYRCGFHAA